MGKQVRTFSNVAMGKQVRTFSNVAMGKQVRMFSIAVFEIRSPSAVYTGTNAFLSITEHAMLNNLNLTGNSTNDHSTS